MFADTPFVLRVGERSDQLDAMLEDAGVATAAFVTAANPGGMPADARENALSTEALLNAQREAGYACFPGAGRDPLGAWPAEPSALVLGISRREAEMLGRSYDQNAIVFFEKGAAAELVVLV
ncbi:MAG TPA: DUF3293 domain-containing protein [Burkholderiales bacterium]|nr:DUF3293 domain-containing protein [Burkholderiales bacterium]